jgi:hypothetical protein
MKRLLGLLMMVGFWSGCGDDTPTGPQGQTLEVETEKWDNGNIKVEFQYYRDGGSVVKHGFYKEYGEDGTIFVDGTYFEGEKSYTANPFASGKWRDSSECGGYSEEEVSEFWNKVENSDVEWGSDRDASSYEAEAALNREHDGDASPRAAILDCQAWLAGNR